MTRLSFSQTQQIMEVKYQCTVAVEGRQNIASGTGYYDFDTLGSGASSITVTGE